MSYSKKNRYPSIKTPGVYRDATDEQLGLNNDDLENFSLGNWNTTFRGNKLLLSGNLLDIIKNRTGIPVKVRTSPPRHGDRVLVWRYRKNENDGYYENSGPNSPYDNRITLIQGPIFSRLSDIEELQTNDGKVINRNFNGEPNTRVRRTLDVYKAYYGEENVIYNESGDDDSIRQINIDNKAQIDDGVPDMERTRPPGSNLFLQFEDGDTGVLLEREEEGDSDLELVIDEDSRGKLSRNVINRRITSDERTIWSSANANRGKDDQFTHELVVLVNFDVQGFNLPSDVQSQLESVRWDSLPVNDKYDVNAPNAYPNASADAITLRGFGESVGNRHRYNGPNNGSNSFPFSINSIAAGLPSVNYISGFGYYHVGDSYGANIGAVDVDLEDDWIPSFEWPEKIRFSNDLTFSLKGVRSELSDEQIRAVDRHFNFLNYPTFELEIVISDPEYIRGLNSFDETVDFIVYTETDKGTELLYYDSEDDKEDYMETSYPVNVELNLGLLGFPAFQNNYFSFDSDEIINAFGGGGLAARDFLNDTGSINLPHYASNPQFCYYRYQVIQWGDEKQLLTDDQIENSYFFNFYDTEEYPNPGDFFYRKYQQSQEVETVPITQKLEHSYNTPGIKTIKIIAYRYHPNTAFILQTYLVTKNIVVGDGVLKSQDFSVFGTSDFNFLPVTNNQVIIGGFDGDSKYNNSIEQMVKDDLFGRDEFLDRVSSREFIKDFNNQLLGENISQMDVGNTRMFNKPKDIYDFIGGNKLDWITYESGSSLSGSLPLNSLATTILIDNEDCILDLNPSKSEYLAIENNF